MIRILVVDDEAAITTQLEERLTRMNYEVVGTAASGPEAVALARETGPDIVLMDIVMPGRMDGIEAARIIKKEWDIPVVFLSAYGDDDYIERAKCAEPLGFLIKPFQLNTLRATLEIALHNQALTRNIKESETGWRRMLEEFSQAMILCDSGGEIYFWNAGAEKIFGRTPEDARGRTFLSLLSEGTPREARRAVAEAPARAGSESGERWWEGIGLRADWTRFPLEFCLSPIRVGDLSSIIIIARDLSSRRRRENRLRASLREREANLTQIRSQVENHLVLIYDLLRLQGEFLQRDGPEDDLSGKDVSPERLTGLLERLSPSAAGAAIDFPIYAQGLARRLMRVYRADPERIQLKFRMDDVRIDLRAAIPWGIILSELVANAIRHAFPEGRKGRIGLEVRALAPDGYRLSVEDDGIGLPAGFDIRSSAARGLRLVDKLTEQLRGRIQMDRGNGTCFRILLPSP